jgi:hypothetical protein
MKEINDNNYNINIFNISYGLQEDLGKKLEDKIQGIKKNKDIDKVFIDSSDISEDDNNMNYYENFLESIKKESNEINLPKSKHSSPSNLPKKHSGSPKKKSINQKDIKRKSNNEDNINNPNKENCLSLQNNNAVVVHSNSNYEDSYQFNSNSNSNIYEQNNFIKFKSNSSVKNLDKNKFFFEDFQKEKKPQKYLINEVSKYVNDVNLIKGASVGTPKSNKKFFNYPKQKKAPRHSTFLVDDEQKKEKSDKKRTRSIFLVHEDNQHLNYNIPQHHSSNNIHNRNNFKTKNSSNNNDNINNNINNNNNDEHILDINQFKKKKTIKLKKTEVSVKNNNDKIDTSKEQTYNNNFISNVNDSNKNISTLGKKKKLFLCCIPIG